MCEKCVFLTVDNLCLLLSESTIILTRVEFILLTSQLIQDLENRSLKKLPSYQSFVFALDKVYPLLAEI